MLGFDKATYLLLLFSFIFSVRLSNRLWGSDVFFLFPIFGIHKYIIHFCIMPVSNSLYCYILFY